MSLSAPLRALGRQAVVLHAQALQRTPKLRASAAQAPQKGHPSRERWSFTLKPYRGRLSFEPPPLKRPKRGARAMLSLRMINQPSEDAIRNSKNYSSPRKMFHSSTQKGITLLTGV
ncbi:hypothetical protein LR48_Vigan10g126000 [Vigna angularis]|uniref:Uncharacterized protein n=1 Tax=Phaseolus angularis TaxID=3914 RepID=A0A0L9VK53_PHAAN|nr:hypothetical protein LR48_Vigan10g126000 [Vigna angularis]